MKHCRIKPIAPSSSNLNVPASPNSLCNCDRPLLVRLFMAGFHFSTVLYGGLSAWRGPIDRPARPPWPDRPTRPIYRFESELFASLILFSLICRLLIVRRPATRRRPAAQPAALRRPPGALNVQLAPNCHAKSTVSRERVQSDLARHEVICRLGCTVRMEFV